MIEKKEILWELFRRFAFFRWLLSSRRLGFFLNLHTISDKSTPHLSASLMRGEPPSEPPPPQLTFAGRMVESQASKKNLLWETKQTKQPKCCCTFEALFLCYSDHVYVHFRVSSFSSSILVACWKLTLRIINDLRRSSFCWLWNYGPFLYSPVYHIYALKTWENSICGF